jgi:hypothetical protein
MCENEKTWACHIENENVWARGVMIQCGVGVWCMWRAFQLSQWFDII